jgi:hypothetical protein
MSVGKKVGREVDLSDGTLLTKIVGKKVGEPTANVGIDDGLIVGR